VNVARRLWRSPALRFLALGAALYVIESRSHRPPDRAVVVSRSAVATLRAELTARLHRPPTRAELSAAVDRSADDERLYREAIERRAWEGDPVLRQRLVERAAWTLRGEAPTAPPTPADLARTLARHPERYAIAPRWSFTQVFVSRAAHPVDGPAVLASLDAALARGDRPDALGDAPPLGREVTDRHATGLAAEYGERFAEVVGSLPEGAWSPPIETRFGWHRVRVTRRLPAATLTVAQAGARLVADWRDDQRADAEEAARQRLRRERPLRYEPGAAP
jgi:hypothetical protein